MLMLDEPTNHLDMESIDSLIEAIEDFKGAVLIVTHSEMVLHAVARKLIVFDAGEIKVFDGTYQDFLDRVGWNNEDGGPPEQAPSSAKSPVINKKNMRKIKAEIITERTRAIGPLQKKITETEETITLLEKQINEDTEKLLQASVKNNGAMIKELNKAIHGAKNKIDLLFNNLATLTDELEKKQGNLKKGSTSFKNFLRNFVKLIPECPISHRLL